MVFELDFEDQEGFRHAKGLNEEEVMLLAMGWTKCFENPFIQNALMLNKLY